MGNYNYKDLGIYFTKSFDPIWSNRHVPYNAETRRFEPENETVLGLHKIAFWRPRIDTYVPTYYLLGDCALPHFDDIHWKNLVPIVTDLSGPNGTALRAPLRFERVWSNRSEDTTESIHKVVSIWRPIAPEGYVSLGLAAGKGFAPPDIDIFRCVRKDLVVESPAGQCIWEDKATGAPTDFSAWDINPPSAQPEEVLLSAGTFVGTNNYQRPHNNPNAYTLRMSIPPLAPSTLPSPPTLSSHFKPTHFENSTITYLTSLPWFTIKDPLLTPLQQISQNHFYTMERTDTYQLVGHGYNNTSTNQRHIWSSTTGVKGSSSITLSASAAIEISAEWSFPMSGCKASAKMSRSFTHTQASSQGWSTSSTFTVWTDIPPQKSVAMFLVTSTYKLLREDGTQVGESISYTDEKSCYWTEFPPGNTCTVTIQPTEVPPV